MKHNKEREDKKLFVGDWNKEMDLFAP